MNDNRQVEVHYINTGFPYTVTESFMDLFEGLTYTHADFFLAGAWPEQEQESAYWSMHTNAYKYGLSGSGSYSYYPYGVNDHLMRMDGDMGAWQNVSVVNNEEPSSLVMHEGESSNPTDAAPEECIRSHHNVSSSQELLDLGEAVGTHNRGLSQERISSLPVSKYKCSFFLRKKARCDRCVICQMVYKRGDRQMTLPCKHIYHASCVSRWLGINKACPVCFAEVFGEESKQ
ncbi:E3 ubiquitin ligase BIG BROTHER-like protein [Cinnamomum micranthum f. kanehirae]|uniref:E3 ubiquitin ligase BIG BROTHER-like protein n=1 Tax=Cinnamomum micranthum f. kanehirae TaxID=337451 RepID=A0A443NWB5_9MAGN|nr:E3 ubiquitin ligase BIG BROTHER-like protein [Cinnamomum micranthum f. kanehirae]